MASGITGTMDAAGDAQARTALAKALNATLLDVTFTLTFAEIEQVLGFPIDHSFLNFKKELTARGWEGARYR